MSASQPLPVNTASKQNSIWQGLDQSAFRKRVDDLGVKSDNYPGLPHAHSSHDWLKQHVLRNRVDPVLSIDVEERLANDFAFLAASQKNVEAVSAVALEELANSQGLIIRLAANGNIKKIVSEKIQTILVLLQKCASKGGHDLRRSILC